MKRIRFWGTRGSLPIALTVAGVRRKLVAALRDASGRPFDSDQEIERYVDGLPLRDRRHVRRPHVLRRARDRRRRLRRLRPRQRPASVRPGGDRAPRPGVAADVSPVRVAPALGSHHGPAVLRAGLHPGQPRHLLRRARGARGRAAPADGAAVVSGRLLARSMRRSSSCTSSPDAPHDVAGMRVTLKRQHHTGDSYGYRFESNGRTVVYSTDSEHKFAEPGERARLRRILPRRGRRDLRRDVLARRCDLGQGRLGSFEQHRRRRAVPARAREGSCACSITSRRSTTRRSRKCSRKRGASRKSRARQ